MSNVHIQFIEDKDGDVVDMLYYHHGCAPEGILGWPNPEALDYVAHCATCLRVMDAIPLTEHGLREALSLFDTNWEDPHIRRLVTRQLTT